MKEREGDKKEKEVKVKTIAASYVVSIPVAEWVTN
jgi:hypothetical protein